MPGRRRPETGGRLAAGALTIVGRGRHGRRRCARIALHLPSARGMALAGGGALVANGMVQRPTRDVDLFTPDPAEVPRVSRDLAEELNARGYAVAVLLDRPEFVRLLATPPGWDPDIDGVQVEIGRDPRMREAVVLDVGRVLHPEEAAANKALTVFDRGAARDLVDVHAVAVTAGYGQERVLELGEEKDPGFDRAVFAQGLGVAAARPDSHFAGLVGLTEAQTAALRQWATDWRAELLAEPRGRAEASVDTGRAGALSDAERDQLRRLHAASFGTGIPPTSARPGSSPLDAAQDAAQGRSAHRPAVQPGQRLRGPLKAGEGLVGAAGSVSPGRGHGWPGAAGRTASR